MALKDLMARGERELAARRVPTNPEPTPAPAPSQAAAPFARTVAPSTSVDSESELEGTLRCRDMLRIDGRIKGRIECEKSVLVGERAHIEASIAGEEVTIAGFVEGDITAARKIILEKTAVVTGDLTTPGIVIEEGAKVRGRILIGTDEQKTTAAAPSPQPAADEKKTDAAEAKAAEARVEEPKAKANGKGRATGSKPVSESTPSAAAS